MLDDDLNTPVYESFDTGPQLQLGASANSLNLGGTLDQLSDGLALGDDGLDDDDLHL